MDMEIPPLNIQGEKVALGPLRRDLLPTLLRWVNDFEVTRGTFGFRPMTMEMEEAWFERAGKPQDDACFLVYARENMRPIGTVALHAIDHRHRTAEFGIMIGEKDCWNRGYGTEATRLTLEYGFTGLGLHNIQLRVFAFNARAYRAYLRAGFREIGRRREAVRLGDTAYDVILMDCLATEFEGSVLRHLLPTAADCAQSRENL